MSIKITIQFGWRWGSESSFYFVRYEQNEMCLNVRWLFFQLAYNSLSSIPAPFCLHAPFTSPLAILHKSYASFIHPLTPHMYPFLHMPPSQSSINLRPLKILKRLLALPGSHHPTRFRASTR